MGLISVRVSVEISVCQQLDALGQSLRVVSMRGVSVRSSLILLQNHRGIIKAQSAHDTMSVTNVLHFSASTGDTEHADSKNSHAKNSPHSRVDDGRRVPSSI